MTHPFFKNRISTKHWILLCLLFVGTTLQAQQLPEIFNAILERDTSYIEMNCTVLIQVQLPGLSIPPKEVQLFMKKNEETRVEGDGIMLIPKRGLMGQFYSILQTPCQSITLKDETDTVIYKLVSLEPESDWVTVDFTISKNDALVHHLNVVTRDNGVFEIANFYGDEFPSIPARTTIRFKALPMKLPLRFIAQNTETDQLFNGDEPIDGMVILNYSDIEIKE